MNVTEHKIKEATAISNFTELKITTTLINIRVGNSIKKYIEFNIIGHLRIRTKQVSAKLVREIRENNNIIKIFYTLAKTNKIYENDKKIFHLIFDFINNVHTKIY